MLERSNPLHPFVYHAIFTDQYMNAAQYLRELSNSRLILWAYFLWYLLVAGSYFDPSWQIWLNALGISAFVGFSLYLNLLVAPTKPEFWQIARCFMTPFCVSSFSALVKNKGFLLIFSPDLRLNLIGLGVIGVFVAVALLLRRKSTS